jgi:arginyl-tRNA synthetase
VKAARTARPGAGDYACPVALQSGRQLGISPSQIAETLLAHIPRPKYLPTAEQRQGYLTFQLSTSWPQQQVYAILRASAVVTQQEDPTDQRVQIERFSANPTGPLTIGRRTRDQRLQSRQAAVV